MITYVYYIILYLVGGVNHLEKYESQWERLSHILWKIKTMFETTNQHSIHVVFRSHLLMVQICSVSMWGFPKMEVPPNGWFIRESTKYH